MGTAGELEDSKEFSHSTILYMREGRFLKALEIVNIKLTMSIKDPSKLFTASDEYKRLINMGTEAVLGVYAPNSYTVASSCAYLQPESIILSAAEAKYIRFLQKYCEAPLHDKNIQVLECQKRTKVHSVNFDISMFRLALERMP